MVFNVIDAHFRYSSGHYAPWSLHSIQNVSVTHACLWCYTDTPVSPSIELAKYHNITEVEQPYFISILPLSIIFHSILEMFRPNSFFFHFILSLKKYYNFFTSEKNPKSDILSSNYNYNSESIWLLWQHQLLLLL